MTKKRKQPNNQLIVQALNAAETNIKLAKQLLNQLPKGDRSASYQSPKDIPGIVGIFEGREMVTQKGERFKVNPNYASKSVLVYGDTLKRIEEDGKEKFKQIERVKRERVEGVLAKKDGRFVAVTAEGSYNVLPEAVEFHGGKEGSEVVVVIPAENKKAPFAAVESIKKKAEEKKPAEVKKPTPKAAPATAAKKRPQKKEEKEEKPKKPVVARVEEKIAADKKVKVEPAAPAPAKVEDDEELR